MKKLIFTSVFAFLISSSMALAQDGWFTFADPTKSVWDDTLPTPGWDTNINVAFFWAPSGDTAVISSLLTSTPTNGATFYSYSSAWSDIITDPNFHVAESNGVDYVATTTVTGLAIYESDAEFGVDGTSPTTTYSIYLIGWNTEGGALTTPSQAAAADAPVGWSAVFSYETVAAPPQGGAPNNMPANRFGVGVVPEPMTLALAGLGGLSMLLLRRWKS